MKSPKIIENDHEDKNKNEERDLTKRCPTPVTVTFFGQNDGKLEICQVEDEKVNLNPFVNYLSDQNGNPFQSINAFHSNNPFCDNENEKEDSSLEGKGSEDEVTLLFLYVELLMHVFVLCSDILKNLQKFVVFLTCTSSNIGSDQNV